ncbi:MULTISPECIES: hypothetical protein [unclassified Paenibacillus]|nr:MULTISPECIES: hypothetical protein [unclassified Paenibacillus]SLJ98071.1 hypothetical protein SAMN06272722_102690 [Paenibacillus sp. RU5A]SOC66825.1 hypothetical protein SAMN05880581_102307 [Paenibacillus sp. RU26A]SOC70026.1 hypothetical protein SAMN05880586_102690 [Paenibacillus sp. RU5M]
MDKEILSKLEIKNGQLLLDGIELKGVTEYELKKSSTEPAELTLRVLVRD